MPEPVPSDTDRAIAARVAELVPDRATVQFGIGGLPSAVCAALAGHRDLGIHSGIITDAAVDLIEAGVVTNAAKRSEEHTSELQSLMRISYAVFCLKKKN